MVYRGQPPKFAPCPRLALFRWAASGPVCLGEQNGARPAADSACCRGAWDAWGWRRGGRGGLPSRLHRLLAPLTGAGAPQEPLPTAATSWHRLQVSLKLQKRLAASVLGCGLRKVWLDPNEVNDISMANSSEWHHPRVARPAGQGARRSCGAPGAGTGDRQAGHARPAQGASSPAWRRAAGREAAAVAAQWSEHWGSSKTGEGAGRHGLEAP